MDFVFKRYETKYILDLDQFNCLIKVIESNMNKDPYGNTTIQSLYFDTSNSILARRSIEKPNYKEKLRLRSYGIKNLDSNVFLEIKKKYDGIVYKRRCEIKQSDIDSFLEYNLNLDNQIGHEMNYFRDFYKTLEKKMLITYERKAYFKDDLRITFDSNIKYRDYDLTLDKGYYGKSLIDKNHILMEIKVSNSYPLWLTSILNLNNIYQTSFSKYGMSYILKEKNISDGDQLWKNYLNPYLQMA